MIGNFRFVYDLSSDFLFEIFVESEPRRQFPKTHDAPVCMRVNRLIQRPRRSQKPRASEQFRARERRAFFRAFEHVSEGRKLFDPARTQFEQQQGRLFRRVDKTLRRGKIGDGRTGKDRRAPLFERRVSRGRREYFIEFQTFFALFHNMLLSV